MKKVALVSGKKPDAETAPAMSGDDMLIQKIINYINENISDPDIKGESIANYVGMSRMNLHRKLKALVGLSSGDFIKKGVAEYKQNNYGDYLRLRLFLSFLFLYLFCEKIRGISYRIQRTP